MAFSLSASLDTVALGKQFQDEGFVSIRGILPAEQAQRIRKGLADFADWNLVFADRGRHIDLSSEQVHSMPPQKRNELMQAVYAQATTGFQYLYNNYPIFDAHREGRNRDHVLHEFYQWIDSEEFLGFARDVTGFDDIAFVDAQATRYNAGHFLTTHDDSQEDKHRRAAYIFNFTPDWPTDWGGLLQLLEEDGNVRRALCPAFNVLNLVKVPQPHSVSIVAPYARGSRHSITGWLRYGDRE